MTPILKNLLLVPPALGVVLVIASITFAIIFAWLGRPRAGFPFLLAALGFACLVSVMPLTLAAVVSQFAGGLSPPLDVLVGVALFAFAVCLYGAFLVFASGWLVGWFVGWFDRSGHITEGRRVILEAVIRLVGVWYALCAGGLLLAVGHVHL